MAEILDIVVITLLVLALIYGAMLNRKISILQQSKEELANLFKSFDETILQAQIGIDDLKKVSEEVSNLLNNKVDKAYILIDDLTFLSEKTAKLANIMDEKVRETQKKVSNIAQSAPANNDYRANNQSFNSPNPEQIKAMRQKNSFEAKKTDLANNNGKPVIDTKKAKVLESLLEQINENKQANQASGTSNKPTKQKSSLDSEQDEEKIVANMLKSIGYGDN